MRTRRWKFVEAPRPELYDLERDPGERQNRLTDHGALADRLKQALPSAPDSPAGRAGQPTAESAERLRALGYVSGSTDASASSRGIDPKDRVEVWAAIEEGIDRMTTDPDAAERLFTRALGLDRSNGLAMKYLGDLSFRRNRPGAAHDWYRRALAAGFRHTDVFVNLASIAEREGHDEEARTMLGEAVQLNAADADAWNRLGLVEARRRAAAARTAFARAIAAAPERAEPYDNLAIVERQAGNEQPAQARLQDAVSRNPGYAKVQYELGTGYLLARDPARALDCYRGALGASGLRRSAVRGCASRPRSGARRRRTALVRRIHPHRTAGVSPADRGRARSPSPAALTRVLSGCPITLVAHFALPASN